MSERPRPCMTPIRYNDDRFEEVECEDPPIGPRVSRREVGDYPSEAFEGRSRSRSEVFGVENPPRRPRPSGSFASLDREPIGCRRRPHDSEFGVDEGLDDFGE